MSKTDKQMREEFERDLREGKFETHNVQDLIKSVKPHGVELHEEAYNKCVNMAFKKYDSGKPRYGLIPPLAEEELAKVLTFGAEKYAPDNWRKVDDLSRYIDAAMRHISAYRKGDSVHDESGLHHLAHAMCCLAFIVELEKEC